MKFCKDCRHAVVPADGKESKWICLHRSALYEEISPVTGELISGQISCKVARTIGECRTEGRYWTPRDDPPVGFV